MRIKRLSKITRKGIAAVLLPVILIASALHVRADDEKYYLSDSEYAADNTYKVLKYKLPFVFEAEDGQTSRTLTRRIILNHADALWFDPPVADCCDKCRQRCEEGVYNSRVFMEAADGTVISAGGLKLSGLGKKNYGKVNIGLELSFESGEVCEYCGKRAGETMRVGAMYVGIPYITFISQPSNANARAGGRAEFDVKADYSGDYKWGMELDGQWFELSDGPGPFGETYSGTDSFHMTVSNLSKDMNGLVYKCRLNGVYNNPVYSDGALMTVTSAAATDPEPERPTPTGVPDDPPVEPDQPSPVPLQPTAPPPKPIPAEPVTVTPTPTLITPSPEEPSPTQVPVTPSPQPTKKPPSTSVYHPKTSSSSVKPREKDDTSSSSTATTERKKEVEPKKDDIIVPVIDDDIIIPEGPDTSSSARTSRTERRKTDTTSKRGTERSSTASRRTIPGSSTVVKDGILYIVEDDIDADPGGRTEVIREDVEADKAYLASDLAVDPALGQQVAQAGFWGTLPGYITVILIILLLLLLALFFLFFGVIITGEVEEHDEVFELCAVRILKRHEGNWCVDLGSAFDDNAVLKLRIGILFAVMFDDWELTGYARGACEGEVTGQISQNMLMYRKNIRRCV